MFFISHRNSINFSGDNGKKSLNFKNKPGSYFFNFLIRNLNENGVAGNGIFNRSVTVTASTNPNYKTVQVTASYTMAKYRQVTLKTIIAEY